MKKTVTQNKRKLLLWLSICVNLGILGTFKYFNFFSENFANAFTLLGYSIDSSRLNIILPVGISFYTFQTLSYTIDIYRRKINPTENIVSFLSFVSFFPQLVAGPIERAINLLPQFQKKRVFNYSDAVDGLQQILWGLFKKVVIADNCAVVANQIFNNSSDFSGSTLLLGAIFFSFQIYGDFSGYSDIAIGTARLFGFKLMQNFSSPYFSRDIAEFWRRWHISLSTWFRDYLYIPLGGSRGGTVFKIRNTFIIFLVSGFWHGANWTFIIWGLLNAIYFLPLLLTNKNRTNLNVVASGRYFPTISDIVKITSTYLLTVLAWVFFRAESISHAFNFISEIFSTSLFSKPSIFPFFTICLITFLLIVEWIGREQEHALQVLNFKKGEANKFQAGFRWCFYYALIFVIILFKGDQQEFIYFQF